MLILCNIYTCKASVHGINNKSKILYYEKRSSDYQLFSVANLTEHGGKGSKKSLPEMNNALIFRNGD
jgi:hypothetical protein